MLYDRSREPGILSTQEEEEISFSSCSVSQKIVVPSGNLTWLWNISIFNGKIHYKWSFSIAVLSYQRVDDVDHGEISIRGFSPGFFPWKLREIR